MIGTQAMNNTAYASLDGIASIIRDALVNWIIKRKDESECFELIRSAESRFLAGRNKRLLEETFNDEPEFEYTCLASRRLKQVMLERSVSQSLERSGNFRFGIDSMG